MYEIKLTKACRLLAEFFADERDQSVGLYKARGGFKREDIVAGAMGEMAVYLWLTKEMGYNVENPDLTLHSKKSFGADLSDGTYCFHVKSQTDTSARKYGQSWILQKSDKLVTEPKPRHYLVLCQVQIDTGIVQILSCVSGIAIAKNMAWGKPKLEWFRKTKVALYLSDIKKKVGKLFTLRRKI